MLSLDFIRTNTEQVAKAISEKNLQVDLAELLRKDAELIRAQQSLDAKRSERNRLAEAFVQLTEAERHANSAAVAIFMLAVGALVLAGRIPALVLLAYVGMSGITAFMYMSDKVAAKTKGWRTEEVTLHMFELFGGWPGAWLAQKAFRHKSRKLTFQIGFWFCVLANVSVLIFFSFPEWR